MRFVQFYHMKWTLKLYILWGSRMKNCNSHTMQKWFPELFILKQFMFCLFLTLWFFILLSKIHDIMVVSKLCLYNSTPTISLGQKWWIIFLKKIKISCNQWEGVTCAQGPRAHNFLSFFFFGLEGGRGVVKRNL